MLHVVRDVRGASIHGNAHKLGPVCVTHRVSVCIFCWITKVAKPVIVFHVAGDCIWVGIVHRGILVRIWIRVSHCESTSGPLPISEARRIVIGGRRWDFKVDDLELIIIERVPVCLHLSQLSKVEAEV